MERIVVIAEAAVATPRLRWPTNLQDCRTLPEETPVALVFDGGTLAVMMATPADLEDFIVGFSLAEGLVERPGELSGLETAWQAQGVEMRAWLAPERGAALARRRRWLAGPTGCGLCGVESLSAALRPARPVCADLHVQPHELLEAMAAMSQAQALGARTRAVHAAGFWREGSLRALREDVGRHNALDKLVGALARAEAPADGIVLLTSRVSVEMVQKAAAFGAPILCAVSAPTALAVRTADDAGVTLVAVCRADGFEVFTHPQRIAT